MQIQENISLKPFNTFGIDAKARYFSVFSDMDELSELTTHDSRLTTLILGGGSNILFTKNYEGLVLKNEIKGIELLHEDESYVYVKAGAGENWHRFVLYCLNNNWAGVENLSLIPGHVGAAPIQNIGAYGVELRDVFWSLEAFHLQEKKKVTFTLSDCAFGYRESVFKSKFKNQFAILDLTLRLRKNPVYHTSYGTIQQELDKMGVKELSIRAISQAVINIRSSKLPDPKQIGNAGSFFKNPSVSDEQFKKLKSDYNDMPGYANADGTFKLAAAWLIERCGWKGFRRGDAGVHTHQALVLVNYGQASGKEIFDLSEEIIQSVKQKFGVTLEREVNIL
jgi:UDP-N-acetylmuramate dehydrogenase